MILQVGYYHGHFTPGESDSQRSCLPCPGPHSCWGRPADLEPGLSLCGCGSLMLDTVVAGWGQLSSSPVSRNRSRKEGSMVCTCILFLVCIHIPSKDISALLSLSASNVLSCVLCPSSDNGATWEVEGKDGGPHPVLSPHLTSLYSFTLLTFFLFFLISALCLIFPSSLLVMLLPSFPICFWSALVVGGLRLACTYQPSAHHHHHHHLHHLTCQVSSIDRALPAGALRGPWVWARPLHHVLLASWPLPAPCETGFLGSQLSTRPRPEQNLLCQGTCKAGSEALTPLTLKGISLLGSCSPELMLNKIQTLPWVRMVSPGAQPVLRPAWRSTPGPRDRSQGC